MRKVLLTTLAGIALVGCSTTSVEQVSAKAKQIQDYTKLFCSFVPTIGTVAAILSKGSSLPVTQIAQDICTAVTTAPLADGPARVPRVYGVVIKGRFVR